MEKITLIIGTILIIIIAGIGIYLTSFSDKDIPIDRPDEIQQEQEITISEIKIPLSTMGKIDGDDIGSITKLNLSKAFISDCAEYKNITYYRLEKDKQIPFYNTTTKNDTIIWTYKNISYVVTKCIDKRKVIKIENITIDLKDLEMDAGETKEGICLDDIYDGNGDGICDRGESYCLMTNTLKCFGHNGNTDRIIHKKDGTTFEMISLKNRLKEAGIK